MTRVKSMDLSSLVGWDRVWKLGCCGLEFAIIYGETDQWYEEFSPE